MSEALKALNYNYFTYTPKNKITKKIVIKAAAFNTNEDIENTLKDSNLPVIRITKLKSRKREETSSFLLEVPMEQNLADYKKISELDHVKVKWEPYYKKAMTTQCYRCQRYGHGSSNCNLPAKSVKCAGDHLTQQCQWKDKTNTPKCANCGGNHTANYLQEIAIRKEKINTKVRQTNPRPINNPQFSRPSISYANKTQNNTSNTDNKIPQPTDNPNKINALFEGINKLYEVCDLDKLLSIVNELNSKLLKGQSALDQIQIIRHTIVKYEQN